jgi:hypothetical protein
LIHLSDEIPGQNADYNMAHDTRSSDLVESFGAGTSHACSFEIISQISQQYFSHKKTSQRSFQPARLAQANGLIT